VEATVDRQALLEREKRFALPVAAASIVAVALMIAGRLISSSAASSGGDGDAALLRGVDDGHGGVLLGLILIAIGTALIAIPLLYLFRATSARSPAVRSNLWGLIVVAPIFLAVSQVLDGIATIQSAADFVALNPGGSTAHMDDIANQVTDNHQTLRAIAQGFAIAGVIGFTFGMVYTCLHASRAGLLTRFWGTLGMALGAVSILLFPLSVFWFGYFAFLVMGRFPGGRPPAWAAGVAIPWPDPSGGSDPGSGGIFEGRGREKKVDSADAGVDVDDGGAEDAASSGGGSSGAPKRKRKRRR